MHKESLETDFKKATKTLTKMSLSKQWKFPGSIIYTFRIHLFIIHAVL